MGGVATLFPGMSTGDVGERLAAGVIRGAPFGPGRVLSILSVPIHVSYVPSPRTGNVYDSFSLLVQLRGSMRTRHRQRECTLTPGDLYLIDGHQPFTLQVADRLSEILVLQMPRQLALSNQPFLERSTARPFAAAEPGVALLREFVLQAVRAIPALTEEQRGTALTAIMRMLAVPEQSAVSVQDMLDWRVTSALAYIQERLCDPELGADEVARAQNISRRRLDQLCQRSSGSTLTAHIWERRLALAEDVLADPAHGLRSVTEVALATGFKSPAHFTRAFRRRNGITPQEWRVNGADATGLRDRH